MVCQTRNPLALVHFANDPQRGGQPNIMIAAYDWAAPLPGEGTRCRGFALFLCLPSQLTPACM